MSLWTDALKYILGQPGGVSVSVTPGTGYDTAAAEAAAAADLERLQHEAILMFPADPLPGGRWSTKCNFGAMHVADGKGCRDLDGMNATCIVRHLLNLCLTKPEDWREDSWERGVEHAKKGGLVVYGIEAPPGDAHGHVVTGAPRDMQEGHWGPVPIAANVGMPPNDFKKLSACFLDSERAAIKCFLWRP